MAIKQVTLLGANNNIGCSIVKVYILEIALIFYKPKYFASLNISQSKTF